ncbi:MAG TPA: glycoside hydrolase family 172 protein [Polyangiales bacterium]
MRRYACWLALLACAVACASDPPPVAVLARYEASGIQLGPSEPALDPQAIFEQLPNLRPTTQALGASSASSKLDNDDFDNYLGEQNGEHVLFDSPGPGTVQRFWHTGNTSFTYRFYFDGEVTPRFVADGSSLWDGASTPFVAPLTLNLFQSSGASVSYYPIAFQKSLRITAQPIVGPASPWDYYNIAYERYFDDRSVISFDGRTDVSALARAWQAAGQPLMAAGANDRTLSSLQTIMPGETIELAALDGPSEIIAMEFSVPALSQAIVTDDGRTTFTGSQFRVAIDPDNRGVRIVRRLDFHVADQSAELSVDGTGVGAWTTPGSDVNDAWRDDSFSLPADVTRGKDAIDVRLDVAGSEWNEYHYWIYSEHDAGERQSDEIDVADADSERAHAYSSFAPTVDGSLSTSYPLDGAGRAALAALAQSRLRITWDDAPSAAIDAPFANFFGSNRDVISNVRALALGRDSERFYCYLPMPFGQRARVSIENGSAVALNDIGFQLRTRPLRPDGGAFGTLHAQYRAVDATALDRDYEILNASGSGHYVGVTMTLPSEQTTLEGNERAYIDGARSPVIAGTGTEDFFNGGWYFLFGSFQTPTHGARVGGDDPVTAYRFNLTDPIPFRSAIRLTIQHGANDDNTLPYSSVAYYYQTDQTHWSRTDTLTPRDAGSAKQHMYDAPASRPISANSHFYDDAATSYGMDGFDLDRSSQFRLALAPGNQGAVLRRLSLASSITQQADVYVDGALAGGWSSRATEDPSLAWREEDFFIPASVCAGKSSLDIAIQKAPGARWTEFGYELFALMP